MTRMTYSNRAFMFVMSLFLLTVVWSERSILFAGNHLINEGTVVTNIDDINNDGFIDFLISTSGRDDFFTGETYLVYGPLEGHLDLSTAVPIIGEAEFSYAGHSFSGAGDVNGDGVGDILIGAWGDEANGRSSGAAYILYGPITDEINLRDADVKVLGEATRDRAGFAVSGVGDVNGDGIDDIMVGSPHHQTGEVRQSGAVYLFYGPLNAGTTNLENADVKFVSNEPLQLVGSSLTNAGDVNGDGLADVLIASREAVYLFTDNLDTGTVDVANATATFRIPSHEIRLTEGSDVNSDGFADILIGDPQADGKGAAYLWHGPVSGEVGIETATAIFKGENQHDQAGHAMTFAGDVNDDGIVDYLIGAPGHAQSTGAAYIVYGPASGNVNLAHAHAQFTGETSGDLVGSSVAPASDADGDGDDDVLVTAPGYNNGAGTIFILTGDATPTNISLSESGSDNTSSMLGIIAITLLSFGGLTFWLYRRRSVS